MISLQYKFTLITNQFNLKQINKVIKKSRIMTTSHNIQKENNMS